MMKRLILLLLLILVGCAGSGGDPAEAVEKYLQAKVSGDEAGIRGLLCTEMESALQREANSFVGVTDPHLEDMQCSRVGDTDVVSCTGKIVATYGTEESEFDLASYRVVEEDGEWKWCGEAE